MREYVIICNRYKGISGSLLFWGSKTKDNEKRSFGGYTSDFDKCEKYTLEDIKNANYSHFKNYEDIKNIRKVEDFYIKIEDLTKLGYRKMTIYYK